MVKLIDLKHVGVKGEGYFCIVKKYHHESTNEHYALKCLKKKHFSNEGYRYRLIREIDLLKELQECDNIIPLCDHGIDEERQSLWYLMHYAEQNLYDYVRRENNQFSLKERFELASQVINAIRFAHDRGILHRDISPNNVLVFFRNGSPLLKVCDFGLGKDSNSISHYTKSSEAGYGQILYVSPEQRGKLNGATNQSDIFSLGKLIYFIFTGRDPDNMKPFELSTLVKKATEEVPKNRHKDVAEFSDHFHSLMELNLDDSVSIEHLTLRELPLYLKDVPIVTVQELLIRGNSEGHVYNDYIDPTVTYMLSQNNLPLYYKSVGNAGIRAFISKFSEKVDECLETTGWPFDAMTGFGELFRNVILLVNDDETRIICFKQLWNLAYGRDRWAVQKFIQVFLKEQYLSKEIVSQLSEHIANSGFEVEMSQFASVVLPPILKNSILQSNKEAEKNKEIRRKRVSRFDSEISDFE